ncbi:hypothetical protein M3Y97_00364300 [Aphelenchoides bicaudatus]|nr:hypothetical protein M3Y97_00364300 [Aphelenchoides bicaudatus]
MYAKWTFVTLLLYVNFGDGANEKLASSVETTSAPEKIPQTIMELNACFKYVPEVRLKINAEHIGGTESIQFKDECLKACLKSIVQKVFICRSLMHIPGEDDCLLTTTDMKHSEFERTNEFPQTNYYENICAQSPYGSSAALSEARFNSFRGGDGILQVAQKYGQPTKALFIIDGIKENTKIQARHYQQNIEDCYKLKKDEIAKSKPLFEATTDYSGSAVLGWTNIELESNHANILETWILIIEGDHNIIECGRIRLALDSHSLANKSSKVVISFASLFLVLTTYIVLSYL